MAEFETVDYSRLETLNLALTNYFAHSLPNGKLYKNTISGLATFMAPFVSSVGASGYVAVTGAALPTPSGLSYSIVGTGTYTHSGGNVNATGVLNIITFNAGVWSLTKALNLDLSAYLESADFNEYNTQYTKLETPLEYGIEINKIYNGDGSTSSSGFWDSILLKIDSTQKYSINNLSGIPLVYIVFYSDKPIASNVIEFRGDGTSPITGNIAIPNGAKYMALDFTKSSPTDSTTYKGSSLVLTIDNSGSVVQEEDFLNLPIRLDDKVTFNKVVGSDGNVSGFTGDWDYITLEVEEGKRYDVVGLKNINIIAYFNSLVFSPSTLVKGETFNGTQRSRSFVAPVGTKYAALSLNKTGTPTDVNSYKKAYILADGIYKHSVSQHANNDIVMYGNSFFQGNYALDADSIEIFLAPKLPNYNIINGGVGGETSLQIIGRQGGAPMYLKNPVTIPANASTRVLIGNRTNGTTAIYSSIQGDVNDNYPLTQAITTEARNTSLINPVLIEGVECLLTWDEATENQYLQRTVTASQPYTTQPKARINTFAMRGLRDSWCNIFFLLTNDPFTNEADMLSKYDKAIEYAGHGRYVVMSEWSDQRFTLLQMISLENEMLKKYGARFFNLRRFAIERALPLLGITPSSGDAARMADGLIPLVLTIDGLHPTTAMYGLIAEQFYQIMLNTGIIKSY